MSYLAMLKCTLFTYLLSGTVISRHMAQLQATVNKGGAVILKSAIMLATPATPTNYIKGAVFMASVVV